MLEARNIRKVYDNDNASLEVLKGVDLKIERGEFAVIAGPSGAGKSTLLHVLGGLDSPAEGQILFQGRDIYKLSDADLCKLRNEKIGFVFQFYHLLPEFTVLENVRMPSMIAGNVQEKKAQALLGQVGLAQRANYFPSQLSGGEKQRVAIARSLMNSPELLLCDEPTGNLDSVTGAQIISLIKKISVENSMSVVVVTHNMDLAKGSGRIYNLRDGVLEN